MDCTCALILRFFSVASRWRRSICRWHHKIRKFCSRILQSINNRTQSLREILCMVIIDIVINTRLSRLTLDPASMHCPAWDNAFVSSVFYTPSLEHCAFEGCIVQTSIALPAGQRIGRFQRGFQCFYQKGLLFQMHYIVIIFVCVHRFV